MSGRWEKSKLLGIRKQDVFVIVKKINRKLQSKEHNKEHHKLQKKMDLQHSKTPKNKKLQK
jgi:hypothetical protein